MLENNLLFRPKLVPLDQCIAMAGEKFIMLTEWRQPICFWSILKHLLVHFDPKLGHFDPGRFKFGRLCWWWPVMSSFCCLKGQLYVFGVFLPENRAHFGPIWPRIWIEAGENLVGFTNGRRWVPCVAGMASHLFPYTDSSPLWLCCQGNKERWWRCRKQKHQHTHPFMFWADSTRGRDSKGREGGLGELWGLGGGGFGAEKLKLSLDPVFPYFVVGTWRLGERRREGESNWSCITICSEREKSSF